VFHEKPQFFTVSFKLKGKLMSSTAFPKRRCCDGGRAPGGGDAVDVGTCVSVAVDAIPTGGAGVANRRDGRR
jgi:hypothetical protein